MVRCLRLGLLRPVCSAVLCLPVLASVTLAMRVSAACVGH